MTAPDSSSVITVIPTVVPLERMKLPPELDGRHGTNRALGTRAAQHDLDGIKTWLARFADTKSTFESYRKEAERLLMWSTSAC